MKRGAVVGIAVALLAVSLAGCRKSPKSDRESAGPAAQMPVEGARGPYGTNYRAPSGEFIIQLPETPEMREEADGRTVYQLRTADYAYTVNKLACPTEFAGDADPKDLYDKLRETIVAAVNGQAMSDTRSSAPAAGSAGASSWCWPGRRIRTSRTRWWCACSATATRCGCSKPSVRRPRSPGPTGSAC